MNFKPYFPIAGILVLVTGLTGWFLTHRHTREPTDPQKALFYQSDYVSVPEGTLIRAQGDERVYYAVQGHKRWIDSADTFEAQGFKPEHIVTLTEDQVSRYPDGEPITSQTALILPGESKILPDLAPLAPYQLKLGSVGGRTVIRFTGSFWNKGYQPFQLLSLNQSKGPAGQEGTEDVFQHVLSADGSDRSKFVGTFVWHPAHHHHHFDNFAEYLLEPAELIPGTKSGPDIRQKTTFCMRDDERMPADTPHAPTTPLFFSCGPQGQGVSPGWIDVYANTLPDQYVDVQDMPAGVYALSFSLDPLKRLIQERADNDIATTLIRLDVPNRTLRVIATLSPFATLSNHADDGTLLRDAQTGNIYVIEHDRKRWMRTTEVFGSYGYNWSSVYPITNEMINAIPNQQLVRQVGTQEVYVVSEKGFARHIRNPDVFASYGFKSADIADINAVDFASYRMSTMILRTGDTTVYLIDGATKHALGALSVLQLNGYDLKELHLVNQTDFDSYITQ